MRIHSPANSTAQGRTALPLMGAEPGAALKDTRGPRLKN